MLVQYARWYRSIYEMPVDRPDDATIEDDAALDRWYIAYQRRAARAATGKAAGGDTYLPTYTEG